MPVKINSISFKNELDPSNPVNWLLTNLLDKLEITIDISVSEYAINSTDNPWVLNNQNGYFTTGSTIWVTGGDFSKFKVGDTIQMYNYVAGGSTYNVTVVEKLSNTEIRISGNPLGWTVNQTGTQDIFSLVNPVTALYFKHNFIENNEALNFYSKVDGTVQLSQITGLNPAGGGTNKPMTAIGALEYQIGSIVVDEVSLTTTPAYSSNFKIKHTIPLTPFMLAPQWDDILNEIAPLYFFNLACMKYVYSIEARYNVNDPNNFQYYEEENVLGNTGWLDESFNTGLTNYSIENLQYVDNTATVIDGVQLLATNNTEFTFDVVNTINSPFDIAASKLVIHFFKAPNSDTEYTNNGRDLTHNFVYDRALLTVGSSPSPVNGDNYADTFLRSLSNLKATKISGDRVRVTGKFTFTADSISVFEESNEPRYMFLISTQDYTKVGAAADRVTLKVDAQKFYYQTQFPNLVTFDRSKLIQHTEDVYSSGASIVGDTFAEDELIGYSEVSIGTDPLVTSFELTKYTAKLSAFNTATNEDFILEQKSITLPNSLIVGGYQYFDISVARNFHLPANEIRKNIVAQATSTGGTYRFAYPFFTRWEYWIANSNINTYFFDILKPLNGLNNDWQRYSDISFGGDWTLKYTCELSAKVNGLPATYKGQSIFKAFDRNLDPSGEGINAITGTINTYNANSLTPLVDGSGKKYILGYDNTRIIATFTKRTTFTKATVVIGLEVFEEGGVSGKRRYSSDWDADSDTWFIPITGVTGTKVKVVGNSTTTITATCDLDYTQIQGLVNKQKWKLTARLYDTVGTATTHTDGKGYLASQDVYMISTNPIDTETTVLDPIKLDCCSDLVWRVLASSTDANLLKNDQNSFLWWFNKDAVDTAVLKLVNSLGTEYILTGSSTYGTSYNYGFYTNGQNEKLVGYLIDWRKVLLALGEDVYKVKCEITTIFGDSQTIYSDSYCLKEYTVERANGTVRIEFYLNGILGIAKNDYKVKDLGTLNWYNQHRFDGYFQFDKSAYKTEYIDYENGQSEFVEDEQTPEYLLSLKPIPASKHDVLRIDILMADDTIITDYNYKNIDNYYKKNVQKVSGYEPKWNTFKTKLSSIELKFKQKYNNLKKFRS